MEDVISIYLKMEDDFNFFPNERQPQFCCKWKKTSIYFVIGRQPKVFHLKVELIFF